MANVQNTTVSQPGLLQNIGSWVGKNIGQPISNAANAIDSGLINFTKGFASGAGNMGVAPPPTPSTPSSTVAANPNTYTLNGKSYDAAGNPSSAPVTSASNYSAPAPSAYQQNLARYGLSSIPPGYSFDASGKLTNGAGQEYTAPTGAGTTGLIPPNGTLNNGVQPSGTNGFNQPGISLTPAGGTPTVNAQGQNTDVQSNVNTGGGTQTNFPSLIGGLASTAATSSPQYQAAQQQYLSANQQLQALQAQAAQQNANILGSRTNLAEAGGEQGLLQNLTANQEAALTGEMQAAQASAAAATGQQGTQQSGLASAAGLVSPQAANIFGTYNPLNPTQYTGYGGGGADQGIAGAAAASGNYSAGQNYYSTMLPAYNQAQSVLNGSSTNQGLLSFLQQNPNINPTSLNSANFVNQWLNNQFSNATYSELGQYLNEFLQSMTPIIGSQGVSDYKSQLVQSMINPTSSTSSLTQQLQNLMSLAQGKMNATYQSFTGQGNNVSGNGTSNNTTYQPYFGS